ncbi:MAB_1171c family putative transporter [Amycolatopsis sp. PS_44_ISF1]|uniref:MAB_1171c family putative transporter n=1 Tax=Amycolatopsis sp. PS_44_ISF1 TaxID=2974917 RepID=UPI0028E0258C|nr:MAB_1171c family putative transporter [Amycolatopsis sp. PS_44_ISF1]MDT8909544.1 hypothetical protein [Amycolatopsis sp. PS_44_ISF1]
MNPLTLLGVVLFTSTLGWRVYQLVRSPRLPNWAVTVTIAGFAAAFLFQQKAISDWIDALTAPGGARLTNNVLLACAACGLLVFFHGSALGAGQARRVLLELVPLAAAVTLMSVATVVTPAPLRGAALSPDTVHVAGTAMFYLGAGLYLIYAIAASGWWITRYQRTADRHLRTGLRLAAAGLAGAAIGSAFRALYIVVAWAFGPVVPALLWLGVPFVIVGSLLFLAGITYPGVRARVSELNRRRRRRQDLDRLAPLWTLLAQAYPSVVLRTPPGGLRERFAVHRRYYRRVIEIRDGLVQLSPYLETDFAALTAEDPAAAANALRRALERHRAGEETDGRAKLVLPGGANDLESDVRPLLALSAAVSGKGA